MKNQKENFDRTIKRTEKMLGGKRMEEQEKQPAVTWKEMLERDSIVRFAEAYKKFNEVFKPFHDIGMGQREVVELFKLYMSGTGRGFVKRIWDSIKEPKDGTNGEDTESS